MESLSQRLNQLAKLPSPTQGPKLYKEGEGGTLQQVGREADNAWAGVKRIMALLNVESKAFDTQTSFTASTAGNFLDCSNIAQGVGDNQRTGDSLRVQRIRAKFQLAYGSANTVVCCVVGRSKDGAPAIADIFETIASGYSSVTFENHDQRKADQILLWRNVTVSSTDVLKFVELDLNHLPDIPTTFANATTTKTAGAYWAAVICGAGGGTGPTCVFNARIDFVDN